MTRSDTERSQDILEANLSSGWVADVTDEIFSATQSIVICRNKGWRSQGKRI